MQYGKLSLPLLAESVTSFDGGATCSDWLNLLQHLMMVQRVPIG